MEFFTIFSISVLAAIVAKTLYDGQINRFFRRFVKDSKIILVVSQGGTCRAPMATLIMGQLIKIKRPEFKGVKFIACGIGPTTEKFASYAARRVVHELFGKDLLKNWHPKQVTQGLINEAELILAMDRGQMNDKIFPPDRTILFKEFFGLHGDVKDPFPDGRDDKTVSRYRGCANEIKFIVEEKFQFLEEFLCPSSRLSKKITMHDHRTQN